MTLIKTRAKNTRLKADRIILSSLVSGTKNSITIMVVSKIPPIGTIRDPSLNLLTVNEPRITKHKLTGTKKWPILSPKIAA